ncbi:MAG: hypothetical protein AAF483_03700 [Planctomycetota bacterium]
MQDGEPSDHSPFEPEDFSKEASDANSVAPLKDESSDSPQGHSVFFSEPPMVGYQPGHPPERQEYLLQVLDDTVENLPGLPVIRWSVLGFVILLCFLGNIFLPALFWRHNRFGDATEYLALFASGFLIAQIGMLALWTAIGTQAFQWRFAGTMLLSLFVGATFVLGLQVPDWIQGRTSDMPAFVGIIIFCIALGGLVVASPLMALMTRLSGFRLVEKRDLRKAGSGANSISIIYLIGITTAVALAVAVLRAVMPANGDNGMPFETVFMCLFILQTAIYCCLLLMGSALFFLSISRNWLGALLFGLVLFFGLPLNFFILSFHRFVRVNSEMVGMYTCMILGFAIAIFLFNAMLRLTGYKLVPR